MVIWQLALSAGKEGYSGYPNGYPKSTGCMQYGANLLFFNVVNKQTFIQIQLIVWFCVK